MWKEMLLRFSSPIPVVSFHIGPSFICPLSSFKMIANMIRTVDYFKIFRSIIKSVFIFVMDNFIRLKRSIYNLFYNNSVFVSPFIPNFYFNILKVATIGYAFTAFLFIFMIPYTYPAFTEFLYPCFMVTWFIFTIKALPWIPICRSINSWFRNNGLITNSTGFIFRWFHNEILPQES